MINGFGSLLIVSTVIKISLLILLFPFFLSHVNMVTSRSKRKTNKAGTKMLTLKLQNVESTNQMGDSDSFI